MSDEPQQPTEPRHLTNEQKDAIRDEAGNAVAKILAGLFDTFNAAKPAEDKVCQACLAKALVWGGIEATAALVEVAAQGDIQETLMFVSLFTTHVMRRLVVVDRSSPAPDAVPGVH